MIEWIQTGESAINTPLTVARDMPGTGKVLMIAGYCCSYSVPSATGVAQLWFAGQYLGGYMVAGARPGRIAFPHPICGYENTNFAIVLAAAAGAKGEIVIWGYTVDAGSANALMAATWYGWAQGAGAPVLPRYPTPGTTEVLLCRPFTCESVQGLPPALARRLLTGRGNLFPFVPGR